jgi:hypothetical protein
MPANLVKLIADLQQVVRQISDTNGKEEGQPAPRCARQPEASVITSCSVYFVTGKPLRSPHNPT